MGTSNRVATCLDSTARAANKPPAATQRSEGGRAPVARPYARQHKAPIAQTFIRISPLKASPSGGASVNIDTKAQPTAATAPARAYPARRAATKHSAP